MRGFGDVADRLKLLLRPGVRRTLVGAVAADSVGQGVLIATTTFYMLRVAGLTAVQVGFGLTLAAVLGIVVSTPIGHAADRWNPLRLTVLMTALQAVAVLGFIVVHNLLSYLLVTAFQAIAVASASVTGAAMLPTIVPPEQRVRTRATTRVTSNVGISVGVGVGGVAVGVGSADLYRLLFAVSAIGLLLSAWFFDRLRRYQTLTSPVAASGTDQDASAPAGTDPAAPQERSDDSAAAALKDRPFLVVTVISALLAINDGLLTVALPLWISQATSVPPWIYSVAIVLNTLAVVLFQIPLSRSSETTAGAGRALRISGVALATACLLWAVAGSPDTAWPAAALVLVGCVAHVIGELTSSAGGWALSYSLAPEHAHGRYQGVFGTGQQISNAVVPVVTGVFLINNGVGGWAIVAGVLLVAGLGAPRAVAWAERTPPRTSPVPAEATGRIS